MAEGSYRQFCPVAMAAEILGARWTLMVVRELVAGSTRFNDLRRGLTRMSPALLSKRLKDLEAAGIVERVPAREGEGHEYRLTQAGQELQPVIEALGCWGHRWVESELTLENLDAGLLMWDMRRNLNTQPMPRRKTTILLLYPELPPQDRRWWLVVEPDGTVDLCSVDPGFDVALHITADLRAMTEIWLGLLPITRAIDTRRITLVGDREIEGKIQRWLGLSPFAAVERKVA